MSEHACLGVICHIVCLVLVLILVYFKGLATKLYRITTSKAKSLFRRLAMTLNKVLHVLIVYIMSVKSLDVCAAEVNLIVIT